MPGVRRKIEFQGLRATNVLGTFTVIRGFADLRDLALVSRSVPYQGSGLIGGEGYQRRVDEAHVEALKRFLQQGRFRFLPEIILGLRTAGAEPAIVMRKRRKARSDDAYVVRVNLSSLERSSRPLITRIDGNHRLEAAERLAEEWRRSATFKNFATAPFCFVILDSDRPKDDDVAEAMLFNLINSKALPIVSEHSLAVLMKDEASAAIRFGEDPQLYLTRWIRDRVQTWPAGFYDAMADTPLTRLHGTARVLLAPGGISSDRLAALEAQCAELFDPLYDLAVRLVADHRTFVLSAAFLPIAAEVYTRRTALEGAELPRTERLSRAERWLRDFAKWFDQIGGDKLPVPADPTLLWAVFIRAWQRKASSVFIAMSFAEEQSLRDVGQAIKEAIARFNTAHPNSPLEPIRVDEQKGASYEMPRRIFDDIDKSTLLIADLTDEKPNVYCEVGYAKSRGVPFILTFHKRPNAAVPPWEKSDATGNKVHFDLTPLRYVAYDNPLHLRDRLKEELEALHENFFSLVP